jgi:dipeptidyl aminopeptidase/acylaminoacyl peptidase
MRKDKVKRFLLVAPLLAVLFQISNAEGAANSDRATVLKNREVIELPPFSGISDRPLIHLYAAEPDYEKARADTGFVMERLVYASDALEVVALLYRAKESRNPQPAIVFNRGSYIRQDTAAEYLVSFHRLARAGYSILAPMYRGSEGAGGEDQMGGDDLNDLMRIVDLSGELPSIDGRRLFLLGESRGGMMVLQAIRQGFPARAAAVYGAPTDFHRLFSDDPERYDPIADKLWPGWRTRADEILGRRSAVTWAEQIDMPVLIMHGGNDQSMPVTQSLALAGRLQELKKVYSLHIFGYDNHVISGNAAERDAEVVAWFRRHAAN